MSDTTSHDDRLDVRRRAWAGCTGACSSRSRRECRTRPGLVLGGRKRATERIQEQAKRREERCLSFARYGLVRVCVRGSDPTMASADLRDLAYGQARPVWSRADPITSALRHPARSAENSTSGRNADGRDRSVGPGHSDAWLHAKNIYIKCIAIQDLLKRLTAAEMRRPSSVLGR